MRLSGLSSTINVYRAYLGRPLICIRKFHETIVSGETFGVESKFRKRPNVSPSVPLALSHLPPHVQNVLQKRFSHDEMEAIVAPPSLLSSPLSPFHCNMVGLQEGADFLAGFIKHNQQPLERVRKTILVFGDYDADGISSAAIMTSYLDSVTIPGSVDTQIAERSNGYGFRLCYAQDIVRRNQLFPEKKIGVVILLDLGIGDHDSINHLKENDIDCIVIDHHLIHKELGPPKGSVVNINPNMNICRFPYKNLCAAGLTWYLVCRLDFVLQSMSLERKLDPFTLLDFAAVATVCDVAPLTGVNRSIVLLGLDLMKENPRKCFEMLFSQYLKCKPRDVDEGSLAFQIGPRLNATGRIREARTAYDFLMEQHDDLKLTELGKLLNDANEERKELTERAFDESLAMLWDQWHFGQEKICSLPPKPPHIACIVVSSKKWNAGILGPLASRLVDVYSVPTFCLTEDSSKNSVPTAKGSGRSDGVFSLTEIREKLNFLLLQSGGHDMACGISLEIKNISIFRQGASDYCYQVSKKEGHLAEDQDANCNYDEEIRISDSFWTADNVKQLETLKPFGLGNPPPVFFSSRVSIVSKYIIKGRFLALQLSQDQPDSDGENINQSLTVNNVKSESLKAKKRNNNTKHSPLLIGNPLPFSPFFSAPPLSKCPGAKFSAICLNMRGEDVHTSINVGDRLNILYEPSKIKGSAKRVTFRITNWETTG